MKKGCSKIIRRALESGGQKFRRASSGVTTAPESAPNL